VIINPTKSNINIRRQGETARHIYTLFIRIKALIFCLNSYGYANTQTFASDGKFFFVETE